MEHRAARRVGRALLLASLCAACSGQPGGGSPVCDSGTGWYPDTDTGTGADTGTDADADADAGTDAGGEEDAGTDAGSAPSFGFFVFSDSHVSEDRGPFLSAVLQMELIDPDAVAAISLGDHTYSASDDEWDHHMQAIGWVFSSAATGFGDPPRYLAALGNHDTYGADWFDNWSERMTGQEGLGYSKENGVYWSVLYRNVLLVARDSIHTSSATLSYADAQTVELRSLLESSPARFRFIFFHRPVYSCNTTHDGFAAALPWLDLAERYDVDAVFAGHTHVYSRTCRLRRSHCTSDGTGTVLVETGTVSGFARAVNVGVELVAGTDADGAMRLDFYNCTVGLGTSMMEATRSSTNTFCHVQIDDCRATISCYEVAEGNTVPFDVWEIDHC